MSQQPIGLSTLLALCLESEPQEVHSLGCTVEAVWPDGRRAHASLFDGGGFKKLNRANDRAVEVAAAMQTREGRLKLQGEIA